MAGLGYCEVHCFVDTVPWVHRVLRQAGKSLMYWQARGHGIWPNIVTCPFHLPSLRPGLSGSWVLELFHGLHFSKYPCPGCPLPTRQALIPFRHQAVSSTVYSSMARSKNFLFACRPQPDAKVLWDQRQLGDRQCKG